MATTKSCTIRLLNKSYEIKCPEDETDNLQQAAQKLNQILLEKRSEFKQLNEHGVMLLAALQLSHELITTNSEKEQQQRQLSQFINTLESKINLAAGEEVLEASAT